MGKVTIQDILDDGFRAEQFGTPADFDAADTGYLARVIADAATWLAAAVGQAAYDAATEGAAKLRLKRAELCFVRAVLWRRRAAFVDSNAQSALEAGAYLERRGYLEQAEQADACAEHWLRQFTTEGRDTSGSPAASLGHVASGPFAASGALT